MLPVPWPAVTVTSASDILRQFVQLQSIQSLFSASVLLSKGIIIRGGVNDYVAINALRQQLGRIFELQYQFLCSLATYCVTRRRYQRCSYRTAFRLPSEPQTLRSFRTG